MWSFLREISSGKRYTLNFDGSHNNQADKSGAGFIIRDDKGEFKLAGSYYSSYGNVAIAEAMALLNGLKLAKQNNISINTIRGDNTEVINHVFNRSRSREQRLNDIINQIIRMIDLNSPTIQIVPREANKVADKLAFWESNSSLLYGYKIYTNYSDLPPKVATLIEQEKSCNGEGSSTLSNIVKVAGGLATAAAGAAIVYGLSTLSEDNSSNNSQRPQIGGSSNLISRESSYSSYDHEENTRNHAPLYSQNRDFYTLNFDGSDINQHQKGGAGCIIRNKERDLVIAASYNLDKLHPDQRHVGIAEAIALRNGLKLAEETNVKLGLIEGDSQEVIDRVRGREMRPPKVPYMNEIINEIRDALNDQSINAKTQLKRIDREYNKVADELASNGSKLGSGEEETYNRDDMLTSKLAWLIEEDKSAEGISR